MMKATAHFMYFDPALGEYAEVFVPMLVLSDNEATENFIENEMFKTKPEYVLFEDLPEEGE